MDGKRERERERERGNGMKDRSWKERYVRREGFEENR